MMWSGARASARWIPVLVSIGLAVVMVAPMPRAAAKAATQQSRVSYQQWTTAADFAGGTSEGVEPYGTDAITIAQPAGTASYTDPFGGATKTWDYARWTSPTVPVGFGATQLVASWNADTPHGSWLQVEMRGHTGAGADTKWYVMGRWAADDPGEGGDIHRTSVPARPTRTATSASTPSSPSNSLTSYQLRVTLYRLPGAQVQPGCARWARWPRSCRTGRPCRSARSAAPRASS